MAKRKTPQRSGPLPVTPAGAVQPDWEVIRDYGWKKQYRDPAGKFHWVELAPRPKAVKKEKVATEKAGKAAKQDGALKQLDAILDAGEESKTEDVEIGTGDAPSEDDFENEDDEDTEDESPAMDNETAAAGVVANVVASPVVTDAAPVFPVELPVVPVAQSGDVIPPGTPRSAYQSTHRSQLEDDTDTIFRPFFWYRALTNSMQGRLIAFMVGGPAMITLAYAVVMLSGPANKTYGVLAVLTTGFWLAGKWAGKTCTRPVLIALRDGDDAPYYDLQKWWAKKEMGWPDSWRLQFERQDGTGRVQGKAESVLAIDATEDDVVRLVDGVWKAQLDIAGNTQRALAGRRVHSSPNSTGLIQSTGSATTADFALSPLLQKAARRLLSLNANEGRTAKILTYMLIIGVALVALYLAAGKFDKFRRGSPITVQGVPSSSTGEEIPAAGVVDPIRIDPTVIVRPE
jgi:hypothetical protein